MTVTDPRGGQDITCDFSRLHFGDAHIWVLTGTVDRRLYALELYVFCLCGLGASTTIPLRLLVLHLWITGDTCLKTRLGIGHDCRDHDPCASVPQPS